MQQPGMIHSKPPSETFRKNFEAGLSHERKRLGGTHPLFINGRACRSQATPFRDNCPSDSRVLLGKFQRATGEHIAKAIAAARGAYSFWRELGWSQRIAFIRKLGELLAKHEFEFGAGLCLESGKSGADAMAEVAESIDILRLACQEMEAHQGYQRILSANGSERHSSTLEPYGVWAAIAPSNAPLSAAMHMILPALLAGNTVVYKPSSLTPFTALRFYELFHLAGFPIGVVNYLTGPGREIGPRLADHPGIDGLIFAGSRSPGMELYQRFQKQPLRPCILELGGNNPAVVMASANLEDAAQGVFLSAFQSGGQSNSACSRVYVHQQVSKEFMELLLEHAAQVKVGLPEDPETTVGPLRDRETLEAFQRAVRLGRKDGRLRWGGRVLKTNGLAHGCFVEPTIFDHVRKESQLLRDEFQGPILAVTEVRSFAEAVNLANASPYGFSAGIYTQVDDEQAQFLEGIEASVVYCNHRGGATSGSRPEFHAMGGWKGSGTAGKSVAGPYGMSQFMREKHRAVCW